MENPFLGNPKQLAKTWRNLRAQLTSDKTDIQHLEIVAKFWSRSPISAPFIDWDNPSTWLDPWELMYEDIFDAIAVAIGMEYTLLLADDKRWTSDRLQLILACTEDTSVQQLMLVVDNKWLLNCEHATVLLLNDKTQIVIQQKYSYTNKTHVIV